MWVLLLEIASYHPLCALNFGVAPRVLRGLCTRIYVNTTDDGYNIPLPSYNRAT
jgi:hypothetical protein